MILKAEERIDFTEYKIQHLYFENYRYKFDKYYTLIFELINDEGEEYLYLEWDELDIVIYGESREDIIEQLSENINDYWELFIKNDIVLTQKEEEVASFLFGHCIREEMKADTLEEEVEEVEYDVF